MTNNTTAGTTASGAGEGISATTQALIELITQRDAAGRAKYGATLDRADLSPADWLQHMAEELLDGAGYALAAKREADTLRAQLEAAEAKLACCMGAGDGSGRLFVYGDYDSIKAAQAIVLRAEAAEADAARWQHARKLLAIEDIENLQAAYESFGRMTNQYECARADAAIDAAIARTKAVTP